MTIDIFFMTTVRHNKFRVSSLVTRCGILFLRIFDGKEGKEPWCHRLTDSRVKLSRLHICTKQKQNEKIYRQYERSSRYVLRTCTHLKLRDRYFFETCANSGRDRFDPMNSECPKNDDAIVLMETS